MATRNYRKYDGDFKQGAVALVFETGKPIAQVARELGVNEGALGNWCAKARVAAAEHGFVHLSDGPVDDPTLQMWAARIPR